MTGRESIKEALAINAELKAKEKAKAQALAQIQAAKESARLAGLQSQRDEAEFRRSKDYENLVKQGVSKPDYQQFLDGAYEGY